MMLKAVDCIAFVICMIVLVGLCGAVLLHALHELIWGAFRELSEMWVGNRITIWIVLASLAWCGFRWKHLNKP